MCWCCAQPTPAGQLDRLRRHRVGHIVLGEDRVDLGGALRLLAQRHGSAWCESTRAAASTERCCGPGLADQLSIVIAPYLAASATAGPVPLIAEPGSPDAVALELAAVERLRQGHMWLRYDVRDRPHGHSGGPDRATP
jgi:riboflavin biosynthesis pyrimidine reductase